MSTATEQVWTLGSLLDWTAKHLAQKQIDTARLDAEVLLDGRQGVLHHLRWADCDPRPLMDSLSERYRLLITLHDLALPVMEESEESPEHAGCGASDCGGGGCGSCATGNCASCGSHRPEVNRLAPPYIPAVEAPPRVPLL